MAGSNRYFLYSETANVQDARDLCDKHSLNYSENDAIQTGIKELSFTCEPDVANSIAQEILNGKIKVTFLNQRLPITGSIGTISASITASDIKVGSTDNTAGNAAYIAVDGSQRIKIAPASAILNGFKTTSGATAVAIAASTLCTTVTIQADVNNTDNVYVGNATSQTILLTPGQSIGNINIDNLSKIYIRRNSADVTINYFGS